jgi:hypothetical protein
VEILRDTKNPQETSRTDWLKLFFPLFFKMNNSIPGLLKSLYVAACCGSTVLVLVTFVRASRRSSVSRTWEPLTPIVNGALELTTVARGANWLVRYGSEKLFGKDQWYLQASHEVLKQRLAQSSILTEMQRWEGHPTISYRADSGALSYEENGPVPKPERFQAQLNLLLHLAELNEQVNGMA